MNYIDEIAAEIAGEAQEGFGEDPRGQLFRLYALLALVRGTGVSRRDVHDAWSAWQTLQGEDHEALVSFDRLDSATQAEDEPFVQAIRRVAERRGLHGS